MSKIVLVTGGGRGIGAAIARLAGQHGYDVCVNYVTRRDRAEAVAEEIREGGQRAMAVKADVSVEGEVLRLFKAVDRELGPLDALVNNCGVITAYGRVEDLTDSDIRRNFDVNVISYILCAREAVRRMSKRHGGHGGTIVNVSSRAATMGMPNEYVHYAAAKGAVDTLTRGLALEVISDGIRVNAVSPGLIDTEMQTPERYRRIASSLPIQRGGRPDEVAEAVLWLLSSKASYVVGGNILVSGGR